MTWSAFLLGLLVGGLLVGLRWMYSLPRRTLSQPEKPRLSAVPRLPRPAEKLPTRHRG